jgi:hypothetical protein
MFKASTRMEGFLKLRYQLSLRLNFFGGDTYVRKNVASPKMKKRAQNITIVSYMFSYCLWRYEIKIYKSSNPTTYLRQFGLCDESFFPFFF